MNEFAEEIGSIEGVHLERVALPEPLVEFAGRFASLEGTVLLASGGDLDCARYHILALKPWLTLTAYSRRVALRSGGKTVEWSGSPFALVKKVAAALAFTPPEADLPVMAGLFGYLGYDLKDRIEDLPRTSVDDLGLPQALLFAPAILLVHDKRRNTDWLCVPRRRTKGGSHWEADLEFARRALAGRDPVPKNAGRERRTCAAAAAGGLQSNFTRPEYLAAVEQVKSYIAAGDVYQVNLSQRFAAGFKGDPFAVFRFLYDRNPAPFFAFIHAGDHVVISTSPERFIELDAGKVETRPIKGTRPRGRTPEADDTERKTLLSSTKDGAELAMIVDLLRNDLGKVCRAGSVKVAEHKRVEAYQNVFHLVSIVTGELEPGRDAVDLILATFPGGSITGCPKIRAMEIIDELEPSRRHLYTGAIGYIGFHGTLDLSIAIRTAVIYQDRLVFSVGGGIVFDSDPVAEYEETLHKGRTLMEAFSPTGQEEGRGAWVWHNGLIKPVEKATVAVSDQGFLYGFGFFETLRADKGKALFLEAHVRRFNRTWEALFGGAPPDLTWKEVITQVLGQNNLLQTAAVRMLAARGREGVSPAVGTLLVTAVPYRHRLLQINAPGIRLATYPHPRQSPLADYKTMNYLYYFLAGQWAREHGADEALIQNPDKSLSETNTASLLFLAGGRAVIPASPHVLPGVMQNEVCGVLQGKGYPAARKRVTAADLMRADAVILTNSLMGAVPVMSLDGRYLEGFSRAAVLCRDLNQKLGLSD